MNQDLTGTPVVRSQNGANDVVIDVKFLLSNREEVSFEEARAELALIHSAVENGACRPLVFGDLSWKAA
jgi:hypothetical protein